MSTNPPALPADLAPDWAAALTPVAGDVVRVLDAVAAREAAGATVLPARADVLRAFRRPLAAVRVLVIGQDPYPTPGHATGLAFSVAPQVRPVPRSLQNVFTELRDDVGVEAPGHGDLTAWADQGVLLLNRVLTVEAGAAGSHRGIGWEAVTDAAVRALVARDAPLVAVLWGNDAARVRPLLGATPVVASAHPSPLSARRGFFGSRPFSRVDTLLEQQGAAPVDWALPSDRLL
ncbi:uracil-DNA glycosylase [Sediminihabitans luteus]|nr:uracil-DNA glycosylase [Sediminihabitans luteus]